MQVKFRIPLMRINIFPSADFFVNYFIGKIISVKISISKLNYR